MSKFSFLWMPLLLLMIICVNLPQTNSAKSKTIRMSVLLQKNKLKSLTNDINSLFGHSNKEKRYLSRRNKLLANKYRIQQLLKVKSFLESLERHVRSARLKHYAEYIHKDKKKSKRKKRKDKGKVLRCINGQDGGVCNLQNSTVNIIPNNNINTPINTKGFSPTSDQNSRQLSYQLPAQVYVQIPKLVPDQTPNEISDQPPKQVPDQISLKISDQTPKQLSEQVSQPIPNQRPRQAVNQAPLVVFDQNSTSRQVTDQTSTQPTVQSSTPNQTSTQIESTTSQTTQQQFMVPFNQISWIRSPDPANPYLDKLVPVIKLSEPLSVLRSQENLTQTQGMSSYQANIAKEAYQAELSKLLPTPSQQSMPLTFSNTGLSPLDLNAIVNPRRSLNDLLLESNVTLNAGTTSDLLMPSTGSYLRQAVPATDFPCSSENNQNSVLEKVLEDVEELKSGKAGMMKEDLPCEVSGNWFSEAGGMILKLCVENKTNVRVTTCESTPKADHGFMLDDAYSFDGIIPFSHSGMIVINGIGQEHKHVTTFIGQCLVCNGAENIVGHWLTTRKARNCIDVKASQQIIGDVMIRENLAQLRQERIDLHSN